MGSVCSTVDLKMGGSEVQGSSVLIKKTKQLVETESFH